MSVSTIRVFRGALIAAPILAAIALSTTAADAAACQVDALQPLFTNIAANAARIAPLLDDCVASGSTDPRLPLLRGVFARSRGDLAGSAALLAQARTADPTSVAALVESGVTDEQRGRFDAANAFYQAALARAPKNRGALLGLARVARAQNRVADARAIYEQLLAADPGDPDALNGLGWLELARRYPDRARVYFHRALAADPANVEAHAGLADAGLSWRTRLDAGGGYTNVAGGSAWSEGTLLTQRIGSSDSAAVGVLHNSNELPAAGFTDQRPLPLDDYQIRWDHDDGHALAWGVQYDDRAHDGLASEQWAAGSVSMAAGTNTHVFALYRTTFGAPEWDGYLASVGAIVNVGGTWSVQGTAFSSAYHPELAPTAFAASRSTSAGDLEVQRQTGRDGVFAGGLGYSPTFGTVNEHVRATLPLSDAIAIVVVASHQTNIPQTRASIGARFQW